MPRAAIFCSERGAWWHALFMPRPSAAIAYCTEGTGMRQLSLLEKPDDKKYYGFGVFTA